jgi:hypothetical protein
MKVKYFLKRMRAPITLAKVAKTATENSIQQKVVELLHHFCRPDVAWFAVPNGEWRYPKTATRLKLQGVRPGAPDLVLCVRGWFHGIEIKRDKGRVSDAQIDMGEEISRANGGYHVCHGLRETVRCLLDLHVFMPEVHFTFDDKEGVTTRAKSKPHPVSGL